MDKGALARALDSWLSRPGELSPEATLLLAASGLLGSAPDSTRRAAALVPLLEAGDSALAAGSRRLGLAAAAVTMPFPNAAIDVDKPADMELVESIILPRSDI